MKIYHSKQAKTYGNNLCMSTFRKREMTQDDKWILRYNDVVTFIDTNKRNPSKHRIEEHDYLNWLKANRKALNAGKLKPERVEKFRKLLELTEQYRRKNQWG